MQTIWSRAALRGACRCPQCLHIPHGITRRATAGSGNAVPRYWTSSTLWLSGTFATAATFDAVAKKHRREQWDAAIAQVKEEIDAVPGYRTDTTTTANDADGLRFIDGREFSGGVCGTDLELLCPEHTGPRLEMRNVPPQSVYAHEQRRARANARPWSPKKLELAMLSMDIFQLTIVEDLHARCWLQKALKAAPESLTALSNLPRAELNQVRLAKIAQLKHLQQNVDSNLEGYQRPFEDIAYCNYTQDLQKTSLHVVNELNTALQALFDAHLSKKISKPALLARIAHNISLSTAAPDINTYNILLLGFAQCHPALIQATVQSLKSTRVRPNEVTNEMLLRYYTRIGNSKLFWKTFRTMRGKSGAQCLARPSIIANPISRLRLRARPSQPDKIYQLPYPTPGVFAAVIEGHLKFAGFKAAMATFREMHEEGWGLCVDGLYPLFRKSLEHEEWDAGLVLWKSIQALRERREKEGTTSTTQNSVGLGLRRHVTTIPLFPCRATMGDSFRRVGVKQQQKTQSLLAEETVQAAADQLADTSTAQLREPVADHLDEKSGVVPSTPSPEPANQPGPKNDETTSSQRRRVTRQRNTLPFTMQATRMNHLLLDRSSSPGLEMTNAP